MTPAEALSQLAAARLQLFNASQKREAVVLRRVRIEAPESLDTINDEISAARAAVLDAMTSVQNAIEAP